MHGTVAYKGAQRTLDSRWRSEMEVIDLADADAGRAQKKAPHLEWKKVVVIRFECIRRYPSCRASTCIGR
jgi:hypothetical protein